MRKSASALAIAAITMLGAVVLPGGVLTPPALAATAAAAPAAATIPASPRDLTYGDLKFEVPRGEDYRFTLPTGQVVYVLEDHALPLATISVTVRAGAWLEPQDKTGLAGLTGSLMSEGGAGKMTAEEFDEAVDFLAVNVSSFIGETSGGASVNTLSRNLDKALDLFFDMMRSPRFQQDRLDIEKGSLLEEMKQRNDDAGDILSREWDWLVYGENHFSTMRATKSDIDSITRDDLVAFHKTWWRPENMIISVSGDVSTKAILADLGKRFTSWKSAGPAPAWPPPNPDHAISPGLYHVEKDIPQGKVRIGHRSTTWNNPDEFALQVMNDILGGGGFTSRITKRVRSDEGLAYSAGSRYSIGTWWPEDFYAAYQSKNATVALAAKLSMEEIRRIRDDLVSDEELQTSKNSFIEVFPRRFESKRSIANLFAEDEYEGRPHSYWQTYRDNIRKVTAEDVRRVAKKYLDPDKTVILVVGKWSEIEPGDPDGRATMKEFFGGKVTHLPLRDPMTLVPMKGQ